jgi:hypothetical protein
MGGRIVRAKSQILTQVFAQNAPSSSLRDEENALTVQRSGNGKD